MKNKLRRGYWILFYIPENAICEAEYRKRIFLIKFAEQSRDQLWLQNSKHEPDFCFQGEVISVYRSKKQIPPLVRLIFSK